MPTPQLVMESLKMFRVLALLSLLYVQAAPRSVQDGDIDFMFNAPVKLILTTLATQMEMNLIFDNGIKDSRVKFEAKHCWLRQAFDKVLEQENLISWPIDRNIIVVVNNTPEDIQRVQETLSWTIKGIQEQKQATRQQPKEDWIKMLQELERKESLRKFNLKNVALKSAVTALVKELDYVPIFDESVSNQKLDVVFPPTTPIKAVIKLFVNQKLQARILDGNTILVFAQSSNKYESLATWTASLRGEN